MKRHLIITFHLTLSAFLLPFLLMIPFSGFLHLVGGEGGVTKEKVFDLQGPVPSDPLEREAFFRQAFEEHGVRSDFEVIRGKGENLTFRPSSRTYLQAVLNDSGAEVFQVTPSLTNAMMELHKGHGPQLFRYFQMVFGIGLILMALSGVWLAILVPMYRKTLFLSFGAGTILFLLAALL